MTKKTIVMVVLAILMVPATSWAQELMVRYTYGNPSYRSQVQIFSNGSVRHTETTCCPSIVTNVPEPSLTATELS